MPESLRVAILAVVEAAVNELCAWAETHWDADFGERETQVLTWGRPLLAAVLGQVVQAGQPPRLPGRCPACQRDAARARVRTEPRQLVTQCGPITLTLRRAICRHCGTSWRLGEQLRGVPARAQLSPQLVDWLVAEGGESAFRAAAARLARLTGIAVSPETVRQHAEAAGAQLAAEATRDAAVVERTGEPAGPVDPAPGVLVVEIDGVLVRYTSGWQEAKLAVVGGVVDGRVEAVSYLAARLRAETFGLLVAAEAARRGALEIVGWSGPVTGRGLARLRLVLVLGDGAKWIWTLAGDHFGERIEVLDFFHASEHLFALAKAVFGDSSAAAATWASEQRGRLLRDGPAPVLAAIAKLRPGTAAGRAAKRRERGYFTANAERMLYPLYRDDGLPIGSGLVESAAKHVVQQRMKGAGMRWSERGGDAMLALCAHQSTQQAA